MVSANNLFAVVGDFEMKSFFIWRFEDEVRRPQDGMSRKHEKDGDEDVHERQI